MVTRLSLRTFISATILCLFTLHPVWADDTEIFFNSVTDSETQPNLLFVIDGSGSMGWYDCADTSIPPSTTNCNDGTPSGTTTRLERMVSAMENVLENTSNINIGLMRFSHSNSGARVLYPVSDIDQQFCNDEPCGDSYVFDAQSSVSASTDDAFEAAGNGEVFVSEQFVPATTYDGDQTASVTALRFPTLLIPQGATIVDARIDFTSVSDSDDYSDLTFSVEDTGDAQPYTTAYNSITNRTWAYNTVPWNNVPAWTNNSTIESPNLATLIHRVVNKTDWCGGNAASISMRGSGSRLAAAFDRGASDGPVLRVKYRLANIPDTGGCTTSTILQAVNSNEGDAREVLLGSNKDNVSLSTNRQRVWDKHMSGFSFEDVNIPQGSKIKQATLTMTTFVANRNSGDMTIGISLENNASPTAFSTDNKDLTDRTKTSSVTWDNIPTGHNTIANSPDIGPLIETIIDNGDWAEGNRINLFLEKNGGGGTTERNFYSYNKDNTRAARLSITYFAQITKASDQISGPVTDVRTKIREQLNDMVAAHGTPTLGALLEAKRYFAGEAMDYGKTRSATGNYDERYSRVSHPDSYTGGTLNRNANCNANALNGADCWDESISGSPTYVSPFEHECQSNHIVLLTDGVPSTDATAVTAAEALTDKTCATSNQSGETCGEEFALYLNTTDFNTTLPGDQTISTHTIGFNLDIPWLEDIAAKGGGNYYTASSAADLTDAVSNIVAKVHNVDTTFVAPGATIDQFSRLSHRKDVYLALFQPSLKPSWGGNLKRYDLEGSPPALYDASEPPILAVDPTTGAFNADAKSYWSLEADGNDTLAGGAASMLVPDDRTLVTSIGGNADLFSAGNSIKTTNNNLTSSHLGAVDAQERALMIDWIRGIDTTDEDVDGDTTEIRTGIIGDPLHSRPVIVTYAGTADNPDAKSVVFFGTNDGFLHAIDSESGEELFAFMPEELLPNTRIFYDNDPISRNEPRPYGLDGNITLRLVDNDKNGVIDDGDEATLYIGMRRGGRNYYALNISDITSPKYLPDIAGGESKFQELGESWSKPTLATIKVGNENKKVLIFAGGYDNAQDDKSLRSTDSVGRAIYIVDADDLTTTYWVGSGNSADAAANAATEYFIDMQYSFPSDVQVVKTDKDNLASQIYVGDTGGRLWRFDINNGETSGSALVDGGIIADLGTDNEASNARRFFHAPDLSLSRIDGKQVINIAIGSGYQAHPLNTTISDNFYLIRYPFKATGNYGIAKDSTYRPITMDDLFDTTNNKIQQGTPEEITDAQEKLAASKGWFINMERSGEKVLGSSTTLNSVVKFISYVPSFAESGCEPDIGRSFYWSVNLSDGSPNDPDYDESDTTNNGGVLTKDDRYTLIPGGGIAPPVQTIFVASEDTNTITPTDISGTNILREGDTDSLVKRWYWSEYPE